MTTDDRTCSIDGCEASIRCRGWCNTHYRRWLAHGDPLQCYKMSDGGACSVDSCDGPVVGRGWCRKHYSRWHKSGSLDRVLAERGDVCSVEGCGKPHTARGWCAMHYNRWRLGQQVAVCSVDGCDRSVQSRGWCNSHYGRWLRLGDPEATAWDMSLDDVPTCLYRLWDDCGKLLYVGITIDIDRRFMEHGKFSKWWGNVERCGIRVFQTRTEALSAERTAIQSELPAHNQKHMPAA